MKIIAQPDRPTSVQYYLHHTCELENGLLKRVNRIEKEDNSRDNEHVSLSIPLRGLRIMYIFGEKMCWVENQYVSLEPLLHTIVCPLSL